MKKLIFILNLLILSLIIPISCKSEDSGKNTFDAREYWNGIWIEDIFDSSEIKEYVFYKDKDQYFIKGHGDNFPLNFDKEKNIFRFQIAALDSTTEMEFIFINKNVVEYNLKTEDRKSDRETIITKTTRIFLRKDTYFTNKRVILDKDIYIITGDNVNMREKPNITAQVITLLKVADKVKLIKFDSKEAVINNINGKWANVEIESKKGWVFSPFIANIDDFKEIKSFKNCKLAYTFGDSRIGYEFQNNGTFKEKVYKHIYKTDSYYLTGKLFQHKNIIIAVYDKPRIVFRNPYFLADIFYLCDNEKICSRVYNNIYKSE